jgi:cell division septation protein DedD
LASHPHDDGFHEIQLNGKQLVFLFMAATVVSVVIFLCGVLVGRGVQAERRVAEEVALAEVPVADLTSVASGVVAAASADTRSAGSSAGAEDLSYFNRLQRPNEPEAELKPAAAAPVPAPLPAPVAARPEARADEAPVPVPAPAPVEPARTAPPASSGQDWTVQVAALNVRGEADAIARRLATKGYSAYVVTPPNGTPSVFRVRIGPFKTRREADSMASKLQKEEQFKPWVTR